MLEKPILSMLIGVVKLSLNWSEYWEIMGFNMEAIDL